MEYVVVTQIGKNYGLFVAVPRTMLAGLQSTVTALSCADYMTKVLD